MAGSDGDFTIVELDTFTERLKEICDNCGVEYGELYNRAIKIIHWVLARNPEIRPVVQGTKTLRNIKTNRFTQGNKSYPVLRVWYRLSGAKTVELLTVDMVDYVL